VKPGFACILCSIALLAGCGGSYSSPASPTAPTTTATNSTSCFPIVAGCLPLAPPGASRALTGVVKDAVGAPVGGASVAVQEVGLYGDFVVQSAVATDASGAYSIPSVQAFNRGIGWLLVGASKSGYFADFKWWLNFPSDADLNLRLDPLVYISPGTSVRGHIGDAFCAGLGYGGVVNSVTDGTGRPPCQRFALSVPRSGTLEATVSAALYEFDVDIVKPDGTFAAYIGYPYRSGPPMISAPVTAGSLYEIRLAGTPTDFELTTTLR
jgi:hypothetical protein